MSKRAALIELDEAAELLHRAHRVKPSTKKAADAAAELAAAKLVQAASEIRLTKRTTDPQRLSQRIDVLEMLVRACWRIASGLRERSTEPKAQLYKYARNTVYQVATRVERW